ncbi:nucleoside-diphosphate kinase [Streptomyces clavuligerus]|uniref:nucleoside-diphosphate kinase n=1 Tax=Streptomyces clavuligerus TaxID=1901 RepID=UPI00017FFB35|nr:nucleoside-diphosphate kinase [Streptomyces clavuligerus]ANW20136.1 nucleoside-diphosphate kinase [Streptomyces clavuligerus]AXU14762.1 nucleoside-diphosphate kinase [Streptomyces clavuligerus]EDY50213.1 nucleoside diphosphate kinase [Streptomyces clavuligerus]MBY6304790.1 nucleoside-diphosphate kinase [Streptomyces clavuligerus]QCS07532.1 nucleoside-diphosphate kinase [Streptomyces clavuligerus]
MTTSRPDETTPAAAERTLVLIKPDALLRGLAGRVLTRFEEAALKVVGVKMRTMDDAFIRRHYFDLEDRLGPAVYNRSAAFMKQSPIIAFVLEGYDAVATVRKLIGASCPNEAAPGTIRGDFSHFSSAASSATGKGMANVVHASANRREAAYEVELWFAPEELHDYRTLAETLTY